MPDPLLTPAPSFDAPLSLLHACHERILTHCRTLERLQRHLLQHGCDLQAQQAAQTILRYFDTAARHHHADEEQDLFPTLRASGDAAMAQLITELQTAHHGMETAWQALRPPLVALAAGHAAVLDRPTAQHFLDAYRDHVALENSALLPHAARLLNPQQLAAIGRNMARRRGVEPPPYPAR